MSRISTHIGGDCATLLNIAGPKNDVLHEPNLFVSASGQGGNRMSMTHTRGFVLGALVVALVAAMAPLAVTAQSGEGTAYKATAQLAPPDGAPETKAKGKAKTFHLDNGDNSLQKIAITIQNVERRTDYRIVIDGIELGVFSPKGNSKTLKLRFRDPAKGNKLEIPEELQPVDTLQVVEVFNATTGELVLTGTFSSSDGDDG